MTVSYLPVWLLLVNLILPTLLWPLKSFALKGWLAVSVTVQLIGLSTAVYLLSVGHNGSLTLLSSGSLALSFWNSTWTLLFLALIFFIGALILVYTYGYFSSDEGEQKRSLALLTLFLASMQGLVMAENLLLLFIFWEMTTLTSFLLIGHSYEKEEARTSALRALYVTAAGGLAMLAGLLLLKLQLGTLSLNELTQSAQLIPTLPLALIIVGALTKSAQFPWHFWLPGAMAAPTPISAFLHSATMVKAGIFVILVLTPLAREHEWWQPLLTLFGGATALWSSLLALIQRDLKKLLAYTTLGALGIIIVVAASASALALQAAALFIIVHACYKAGLFMMIGHIDHLYQTRQVDQLGALREDHPLLALITSILCLSMAGMVPTLGYFAKEVSYHSLLNHNPLGLIFVFLASVLSVMAAWRIFSTIFLGKKSLHLRDLKEKPHSSALTLIGPGVLAITSILTVMWTPFLEKKLLLPLADMLREPSILAFHWIPPTTSLILLTLFTFASALIFILLANRFNLWQFKPIHLPDLAYLFDRGMKKITSLFAEISHQVFKGAHQRHLALGLIGALAIFICSLTQVNPETLIYPHLTGDLTLWEVALFALIVLPAISIPFIHGRVTALLVGGACGLGICMVFALFSAPDLALTQLIVETLVLVMFIYSINKLPKFFVQNNFSPHYFRLSLAAVFATILTISVSTVSYGPAQDPIWHYFAENSYLKAFGKNVVNVILVDFRAFDTMGEITVLALATVGVLTLLLPKKTPTGFHKSSNIWSVTIGLKMIVPLMLALSLYLLLRGHNAPGGGFIGGLVAGLAWVLQERAPNFSRPFRLIFTGLGLSLVSGLGPIFFGKPIFTAWWGPELFAGVKLGNILLFDIGVFILVVGMVLMISRLLSLEKAH